MPQLTFNIEGKNRFLVKEVQKELCFSLIEEVSAGSLERKYICKANRRMFC